MLPLHTFSRGPCPRTIIAWTRRIHTSPAPASAPAGDETIGTGHPHPRQQQQQLEALRQAVREAHLAEASLARFFQGQALSTCGRPDTATFAEQEAQQLQSVAQLLPRLRVRPSLLLPAAQAAALGAGAASVLAPPALRDAVTAALHDAIGDACNARLADLRAAGVDPSSADAAEVRSLLRRLRDAERVPEGAAAPPDMLALQRMEALEDVGLPGLLGAAVKAVALAVLGAARRL